jgi:hypothetical protein
VVAPFTGGEPLFGNGLTRPELARRYEGGARIVTHQVDGGGIPAGHDVLFLVHPDGQLTPVTQSHRAAPQAGDIAILLGPASAPPPG